MNPNDVAPMVIFVTLALSAGAVFIFRGPVGKAIARRLEGPDRAGSELAGRVAELEARVGELEQERLEVTERLEFTERMLGQLRDPSRELR